MRRLIFLVVVLLAVAAPSVAAADIVNASGASTAGGVKWSFNADYDTATNTLDLTCNLVDSDTGQPVAARAGMEATVAVTQANNQVRTLDCAPLMNLGLQSSKLNLKVDTIGRWSGFYVSTRFTP